MKDVRLCPNCHKEIGADDKFCPYCGSNLSGTHAGAHQLQTNMVLNGRYRIERVIGEGNFGITYLAEDTTLQMKVAVKEFYPKGYVTRESMNSQHITIYEGNKSEYIHKWRRDFINEARNLAKLSGLTGIVEVRDYFEQNGTAYIVMEYLEGDDLSAYIEKHGYTKPNDAQLGLGKRITMEQAKRIMEPVILALEKVHEAGMVHRDISPDNMKFNINGDLKLFDFGAAREADLAGTNEKTVMLKLGYAPEEQYRKLGNQGPWTDVYALCATIYKCITGVIPVEASERTYQDTLKKPSELGIEMSRSDEDALMMGLAVYADKRIKDMNALHMALYNGAAQKPKTLLTPPQIEVVTPAQVITPGQTDKTRKKSGLKIAVAVVAVLAVLAAAGTAAYMLLPDLLATGSFGKEAREEEDIDSEDIDGDDEETGAEEESSAEEDELIAELQEMLDSQEYEDLIEEILGLDEDDLTDEQAEASNGLLSQAIEAHLSQRFDEADGLAQSGDYDGAFAVLDEEAAYRDELAEDKKAEDYIDSQVIADKHDELLQKYSKYVSSKAGEYADTANEMGIEALFANADKYFADQEEYENTKIKAYSALVLSRINQMNNQGESPKQIMDYIEENRSMTQNNCWVLEMWDFFYSQYCGGAPSIWSGVVNNVSNSGYILDYSDSSELSAYDLHQLSAYELRMARYEIYARHGRIFEDQGVNDYFSNYAWYKPRYEAVDFDESSLSDTEKKNIETILAYEVSMGYR